MRREDAVERARDHSPFLGAAMERFPDVARTFLDEGPKAAADSAVLLSGETVAAELRRRRTALALALALGDLAGELGLDDVTSSLSDFADSAIHQSLATALHERVPGAEVRGIAVLALGKLGSRELNFSSDVDLILLFDPATLPRRERDDAGEAAVRIGRRMIDLLQTYSADGYVARVDLRLRPSPEVTPIMLPINAAISYYESAALGWERTAFIRARAAAGDIPLGEEFLDAIRPFVWRRALDYGVIDEIHAMTRAVRDHYAHAQEFGPGFDVKRGRGGIREIEFFAQAHQMIHGGRNSDLRCPATRDALGALAKAGHIDGELSARLSDAYVALRTAEHRVQMIADRQTHVLPTRPESLARVARLHGCGEASAFLDWLQPHVAAVAKAFDNLAEDNRDRLPSDPERLRSALQEMGFEDQDAAIKRISEWRSGRPRSLRSAAARNAFEGMLPNLLAAIARGLNPGHALNRLSDIVDRLSSGINLYRLLEARQDLAQLLARILAHAPALSDQLARRPGLIDGLLDSSSFDPPPSADTFAERLREAMAGQPYDVALDRARRLVNEKRFALGVQLIDGRTDPLDVGRGYSRVAEGAVLALAETATAEFEKAHGKVAGAELLILAVGRLGGGLLTHASDLDLIYLHTAAADSLSDGAKPLGPSDYFNRLASRISAALSVPTAAGPLYEVDTRLRPQGEQGMLAVSLEAFGEYQQKEAWTWEHMALTRARPIFGSGPGRDRMKRILDTILQASRDPAATAADAARMRSDMALHKPPSGDLDVKLGVGGLVDLEFAIHVLQLNTRLGFDPRLEEAVESLGEEGLVDPQIAEAQKLLTRLLIILRLVAPEGQRPPPDTCALVAGLCGFDEFDTLSERVDRARQRISALWAKVKEQKT